MAWHASSRRIVGLYENHADAFDRARGKTLFEQPWLDRFLAELPGGGHILDVGCGSGEPIAAYFVGCGYRVTGLDASRSLIGLCRTRFPDQEWHVGDMRQLRMDRRFDGILAWDSLFHLTPDDQRKTLKAIFDHAGSGAALMFTSGPAAGEAIGSFEGSELYHASLDPEDYRTLLHAHGFEILAHAVEDPDCGGRTIWLARRTE